MFKEWVDLEEATMGIEGLKSFLLTVVGAQLKMWGRQCTRLNELTTPSLFQHVTLGR
jgi:hypothetical protein